MFAPANALSGDGNTRRALVAVDVQGGRGRVEARSVSLGPSRFEDHLEVTSGLRPGDRVLIDAPPDLTAGDYIELVESTTGAR